MTDAVEAALPRIHYNEARQRLANTGYKVWFGEMLYTSPGRGKFVETRSRDMADTLRIHSQGDKHVADLQIDSFGLIDANEVQLIVWAGAQNG